MSEWDDDLRRRLARVPMAPTRQAAIIEELSQHLDDRRRELIAGGMAPERAAELAKDELVRANLLENRLASLRQANWRPEPSPAAPGRSRLGGALQDARYAWRSVRREPLVAVIAILTLAFGIGLNTAMFGFMNALLIRPLPFPDAERVVRVYRTTPQDSSGRLSPAEYISLRRVEQAFGQFAAYQRANFPSAEPGRSTEWTLVSANLFDLLGLAPVHGRLFQPADEIRGQDQVVLISDEFWRDRYAGDPEAVGSTIQAAGRTYEIVGVLPPAATDHRLFSRVGLFSPLSLAGNAALDSTTRSLTVLGRRDRSVSPAQGGAFIASLGSRLASPQAPTPATWRSESLPHSNTGPTGRVLLTMLLGLSFCVLLMACANLANLLLARAIDRVREFAVRSALGASRLQLIRVVLLESALLAAAGGAGALLVAGWTTGWLNSVIVDGGGPRITLDWRVLVFAAVVSMSTVVFCGTVPALFTRDINASVALKSGGRGATAPRGFRRLRHSFIVGQFALAVVLLSGAGFFLRGTVQMLSQHYGWDADNVVQGEIALPEQSYAAPGDIVGAQERILARLEEIPGVEAATVSYGLPYLGLRGQAPYVAESDTGRTQPVTARINGVSPRYFDVTGTRLIAGRSFAHTDHAAARPVAIINQTMARRLFGAIDPVGRRVALAGAEPARWMEVVGVVVDVQSIDVAQEPAPYQLYQPTAQDPRRGLIVAVRVRPDASRTAIPDVRAAIYAVDPQLTVHGLMTAKDRMNDVTSSMKVITRLLTGFAALGTFLASLGIYGAMTRLVAQRRAEIGIRMALGAQVRDVLRVVFGSGLRLVAVGLVVGLAGAIVLSRVLGAVLPRMQTDAVAIGAATLVMLSAVALLACYGPAQRAARVDPLMSLKEE